MSTSKAQMIDYLFERINEKEPFIVVPLGSKITQVAVKESDFENLAISIFQLFAVKLKNFTIAKDGIYKLWESKDFKPNSRTYKILAAYFLIISGEEKLDDVLIGTTKSGKTSTFRVNYWKRYETWLLKAGGHQLAPYSIETHPTGPFKPPNNFNVISQTYWDEVNKLQTGDNDITAYYLDTDSTERLLPKVIGSKQYVQPSEILISAGNVKSSDVLIPLEGFFSVHDLPQTLLLKILGEGGDGKSTFLLHIGNIFCDQFHTIYVKRNSEIPEFYSTVSVPADDKPILVLIDDARNHQNKLTEYAEALTRKYPNRKYAFVIAERTNRYRSDESFEDGFEKKYTCFYKMDDRQLSELFDSFWAKLKSVYHNEVNTLSGIHILSLKNKFISSKGTVCDKVEELFKTLGIGHQLKNRLEEWDDWDFSLTDKFSGIRNLYTIVALFYKFGIPVPLKLFDPLTQSLIIDAVEGRQKLSSAIVLDEENFLKLRHETRADKYLRFSENRRKTENYFDWFLDNIKTKEFAKLFRNLYLHPEFKTTYFLKKHLSLERQERIFREYLESCRDKEEKGKTLIHLCRTLLHNQEIKYKNLQVKEVISLLEGYITENKKNLQVRATLSSILLKINPRRSYELLNQILQIDENNVEAVIHLVGLYSTLPITTGRFERLLLRLISHQGFKSQTLLQIARRLFSVDRLHYAICFLEYYISCYADEESVYLIRKAYSKAADIQLYSQKKQTMGSVGYILAAMRKLNIVGDRKPDALQIRLVDLFMQVEEWNFAKGQLSSISDKSHVNYSIIRARILASQGHYHTAYKLLNALVRVEPDNSSVLVPLIKVAREYMKFEEGQRHALHFLTLESTDSEVSNLFVGMLLDEIGEQKNRFKIAERKLLRKKTKSDKEEKALKYLISFFYFKWAIKSTVNRKRGLSKDSNASRHFSSEKIKLALELLPENVEYLAVRNTYIGALTEVERERF